MKRYEGLFILNTAGKEEGIQDIIDAVRNDVAAAGGKVETVQKMDKRPFSRVANKRFNSGYYVNLVFDIDPSALTQLRHRFDLNDEVFRVLFTIAPPPKPVPAATV